MQVQPITFKGKFIKRDKFKQPTAQFVHDIIKTKVDNVSNEEILLKLPFDVEITRTRKSHKAIHPMISCYINYKQFWGKQSYYVDHGTEYTINQMRKWFIRVSDFIQKNKDKTKLTPKEENDRIYDYILGMSKIRRYKPLQQLALQ